MSNTKNNNSNLPLGIIGLVLVAALVGGWWFYSNSKASPVKSNTNGANKKPPIDDAALLQAYVNAGIKSPGAQPANMLGSPTATVTVEEFADFQCPTCATVHSKMKEINALYSGRIKFVFRNYPLTQMHKNAYAAAVAAEAAGMQDQNKFWAMQDQLFNNQKAWSDSQEARKMFEEYAEKIGLDVARFQNDMLGLPAKARVDADLQRARALNLSGTPTIYVNGRQVPIDTSGVETMRQVIDAELKKVSGSPPPNQPANQTVNTANQSVSAANNSQNSAGNSKDKK